MLDVGGGLFFSPPIKIGGFKMLDVFSTKIASYVRETLKVSLTCEPNII